MLSREVQTWNTPTASRRAGIGVLVVAGTLAGAQVGARLTARLPMPTPRIAAAAPVTPPPGPRFGFVFEVSGTSYLALASLDGETAKIPAHATPELIAHDNWMIDVVAAVRPDDVAAEHRGWIGRSVIVEGGCRATAQGYAVVSRLGGDVSYASGDEREWTRDLAWESGEKLLAVRLDGCHAGFGRDAAHGPVLEAVTVDDVGAVNTAIDDFLASQEAAAAQAKYASDGGEGEFSEQPGVMTSRAVRHPSTGVTWVSIFAHHFEECGGPAVDLLALYRVEPKGKVVRVHVGSLENVSALERLVDVDGDGQFEVIVRDWMGTSQELRDLGGKVVQRLGMAFYGCPC
jgi:hypothetical protein